MMSYLAVCRNKAGSIPPCAHQLHFSISGIWECWLLFLACAVGQLIVGVYLSFITELHKFPDWSLRPLANAGSYCSNKHTSRVLARRFRPKIHSEILGTDFFWSHESKAIHWEWNGNRHSLLLIVNFQCSRQYPKNCQGHQQTQKKIKSWTCKMQSGRAAAGIAAVISLQLLNLTTSKFDNSSRNLNYYSNFLFTISQTLFPDSSASCRTRPRRVKLGVVITTQIRSTTFCRKQSTRRVGFRGTKFGVVYSMGKQEQKWEQLCLSVKGYFSCGQIRTRKFFSLFEYWNR